MTPSPSTIFSILAIYFILSSHILNPNFPTNMDIVILCGFYQKRRINGLDLSFDDIGELCSTLYPLTNIPSVITIHKFPISRFRLRAGAEFPHNFSDERMSPAASHHTWENQRRRDDIPLSNVSPMSLTSWGPIHPSLETLQPSLEYFAKMSVIFK